MNTYNNLEMFLFSLKMYLLFISSSNSLKSLRVNNNNFLLKIKFLYEL